MVKLTKLKRIEKAKTKLKAKKLPKGHNVTDTSFKSKKIIIPGQLKTTDGQDIRTRKKLNIQELLAHLRHHNVSMRREGLSGLTELFAEHEDNIVQLHLPRMIDAVSSLVLDTESEIRKSAFKMIQEILSKISSDQIAPHFDILKTYMSCAMTHINVSIREDSLLLLDCLLNSCPALMVRKADDVLPTFLNMISSAKSNSDHGRTLSLHLNNKLISVQWRMRVFSRLTKYFYAIVSVKKHKSGDSENMHIEDITKSKPKVVKWNENSPFYAAEFMTSKIEICNLPRVFLYTPVLVDNVGQNTANQEKTLKEHVVSLMPVLFEAWVEVAPKRDSAEVKTLSEEAAIMLQYILETLQHVWDCLKCWEEETNIINLTPWFIKYYQKTIMNVFLPGFPFSLEDNVFKPKSTQKPRNILKPEESLFKNKMSLTPKCTQQNLSLCNLLASVYDGKDKAVIKSMFGYLKTCILKWQGVLLIPILEKVLRTLIMDQHNSELRVEILQSIVRKSQDQSASIELRETLFSLLCDFVLQPGYHTELRCEGLEKWISHLPFILFQAEVPMNAVKALTALGSQNHEIFIIHLKKRAKAIINSLCDVQIMGNSTPFEGQKMILDMLFHVVDSNSFDNLLKRIGNSEEHKEVVSYIKNLKALREFVTP